MYIIYIRLIIAKSEYICKTNQSQSDSRVWLKKERKKKCVGANSISHISFACMHGRHALRA